MKVTIKDIAERAGVSVATVSNALNDRKGVNEENRLRILQIARQMGYPSERTAQAGAYIRLISFKRNGRVLMDTQFYAELIAAVEEECRSNALNLSAMTINIEQDYDYMQTIKDVCREECAGLLLLATEMRSVDLEPFFKAVSPVLLLDNVFAHLSINAVCVDNENAGYMATQRLLFMGHRNIAHITYNVHTNNTIVRRHAFESAMREYGLPITEESIWKVSPTMDGAYEDMQRLLEAHASAMPTAFFACNDLVAIGCMRAMQDYGLRVPEDVSIVGMDDLSICQTSNPPLSSVRVPRRQMGRAAVRRLLDMQTRTGPDCVMKTYVDVELIERKSIFDLREL
jgi:DNA-binding LacI/PurR family transcriptional regulator